MNKWLDKAIIPLLIVAIVCSVLTLMGGIYNSKTSSIILGVVLIGLNSLNIMFQLKRREKQKQADFISESSAMRAFTMPLAPNYRGTTSSSNLPSSEFRQLEINVGRSVGQDKTETDQIKEDCKKLEAEQALFPNSIGNLEV